MPFSANCPSCGAPVVFKASVSFHAVCEFCHSTLVRHSGSLKDLGRMADLLEDASPIRLGSEGSYRGVHFAVIGRIQLRYASGVWNEWHILFDDQRSGWLSDASGEYVVSFLKPPGAGLPEYSALALDSTLMLAGQEFLVTNKEEAECIAGEGELPFAFGAGYPAQLADLRAMVAAPGAGGEANKQANFASIDYSETPPLFFLGESVPFAALKLSNLRDSSGNMRAAGEVHALQCPCCGGPISLHDPAVQSVSCPSCFSILDAENTSLKIFQTVKYKEHIKPAIPLGSVGRFHDKDWTVIGFQQRAVIAEGVDYRWQEYLLHQPQEGLRWLVENDGHWNWVSPVTTPPRYSLEEPTLRFGGEEFIRFSAGRAETRYVIGEFNWKVRVGEMWDSTDFIAPPRLLSREASDNEITWSISDYLPAEEVCAAFKLDAAALPEAKGVAANQVNPRSEAHSQVCSQFWKFAALATVAQILWFFVFGSRTLLEQNLVLSAARSDGITTQSFHLDRPARNVVLKHRTDLDNNWVGMNMTLVEKNSGQNWEAQSEVSYWQGVDDGESWSEGDKEKELVFRDLPPGDYYFVIEPEISDENPAAVSDRIRVVRDQAAWSNYILLLLFLVIFPIVSRQRFGSFESERWSNADFNTDGTTPGNDDSDSDGDDD